MLLNKKTLLAGVLVVAAVGTAIGVMAIRSARNQNATALNSSDTAVTPTTNEENRTVSPVAANDAQNGSSTQVSSGASRTRSSRQGVYYDYNSTSQKRSFWEKHRDKLTVAGGAGAGTLVGGLIGGKKGAGIGLLAGGAGSALYTYKLRHKRHRY